VITKKEKISEKCLKKKHGRCAKKLFFSDKH
jgi:hypothetical protein